MKTHLQSSAISFVTYDADHLFLEVYFRDGNIYRYIGVEPEMHLAFLLADSHGKFFNSIIRNNYKVEWIGTWES